MYLNSFNYDYNARRNSGWKESSELLKLTHIEAQPGPVPKHQAKGSPAPFASASFLHAAQYSGAPLKAVPNPSHAASQPALDSVICPPLEKHVRSVPHTHS